MVQPIYSRQNYVFVFVKLNMIETIRWAHPAVRIIDQTQLPVYETYLTIADLDDLIDAIKKLKIRGAPALGIAGAYGLCLGLYRCTTSDKAILRDEAINTAAILIQSRPTAVNLAWGVHRALKVFESVYSTASSTDILRSSVLKEAHLILQEELDACIAMGKLGSELIDDGMQVLTHCNTGGLATGGFGTALGVLVTAHQNGKRIHVWVDETRPLLQGARLTSWELKKENIRHTLICDNMAGHLMSKGRVQAVIVGSDRIARNGDAANKIGTYTLAVLCEKHKIPFYVAAPHSTIDKQIPDGSAITIEERSADEITMGMGKQTAPQGVHVYNPAFDVTPAELISAIITEKQIFRGPDYCFN
ncbi:MAG TPA: S-methyl-5-thioribose-1-phosphate isomerase [bacterium]|nr:S-methyl-5-thioribose-1-phosphate isomerase [bacterium]HNC49236.1 S-methyl-5-thioribose-1-phosphate isomerase [bacterium]HNE82737.1 S-methyl-5-thioribose-1-phosphate isomerase [bacterium]HNH28758.1 S-methyl-5-thioribose-1-phosphate isomerase [bacterium]HNH31505.1 S-methyl-5-thioribose-1-phosphate isomerase [bacterium]